MTIPSPFVSSLTAILPEKSWSWVTAALYQDDLVWKALQTTAFAQDALAQLGSDPEKWTPANLALLELGSPLPDEPANLEARLRNRAIRAYEGQLRGRPAANDTGLILAGDCLLAIALLEHRRLSGSWHGLLADLRPAPLPAWKTSLAILYGLAPDPLKLLHTLLHRAAPPDRMELAVHALLCNPAPPDQQAQVLLQLMADLSMPESVSFLRRLEAIRGDLASSLARQLLSMQPTFANRKRYPNSTAQIDYLAYLLSHGDLHRLAGQSDQVLTLQSLAAEAAQHLQYQLAEQLVAATTQAGRLDEALALWKDHQPPGEPEQGSVAACEPPAELVLALLAAGRPEDVLALYPAGENGEQPAFLLASTHQAAAAGDLPTARALAKQALESARRPLSPAGAGDSEPGGDFANPAVRLPILSALAAAFNDLSLSGHAVLAARMAVGLLPGNPDLLLALGRAQRAARDPRAAAANAQLAVALAPGRAAPRRELAASLEAAGEWERAFTERRALLNGRFNPVPGQSWPSASDLYALAACGIQAGQPQHAAEMCRLALEADPQDGLARSLLGEALFSQGAHQEALLHFERGVEASPHQAATWLLLSRAHRKLGNRDKCVESLRAACQTAPDKPALHLELARIYLEDDALTQALTCLQHAHQLASRPLQLSQSLDLPAEHHATQAWPLSGQPGPFKIALHLGKTLHKLGHLPQARQVLESAYHDQPAEPGLAYAYARILLDLEAVSEALEALRIAMEVQPEEVGPYLDYAASLLEIKADPQEAERALRRALELAPGQPRALALLAESLAAQGDLEPAMKTYYRALESDLSRDPAWHGRLSFGLGVVALQLGQPETASASLHEAVRVEPQNPAIHRAMASAYMQLDLPDEAFRSAQLALQLANDDLATITWFAEQAVELRALPEAAAALARGIEIAPHDTALQLRLGQVQSLAGDIPAARQTFHGILKAGAPGAEVLAGAASELLDLHDAVTAVACLERAIALLPAPTTGLLRDLAEALWQSGAPARALESLDHAIALDPLDPALYLAKVDLLTSLDRPQDAQLCLEQGLEQNPDDPDLHQRMVLALRLRGEIASALQHAERMVAALQADCGTQKDLAARALAAELARALVQTRLARSFLEVPTKDTGLCLPFYCLSAELALEEGEEIAAASALTKAVELDSEHPRVLALQVRLTFRQGDNGAATHTLQSLLECLGNADGWDAVLDPAFSARAEQTGRANVDETIRGPHQSLTSGYEQVAALLGIASAALDLGHWSVALYLLRQASALAPHEPYYHLQLARALVLRADYQRLCQSLEVVAHAPGDSALAEQTFRSFEATMRAAAAGLPAERAAGEDPAQAVMSRWQARGRAAFNPDSQSLQALGALANGPEDDAAHMAALGEVGDLASLGKESLSGLVDAKPMPYHHRYLAQLALILGTKGRRDADLVHALNAAAAAVDQQPQQPLYHALYAYLATRVGDTGAALAAIRTALSLWPEETRWQAHAAQLLLAAGDPQGAIGHLSIATQREPRYLPHYLALGAAYQQNGDALLAIRAYEQARHIAPDGLEPNLALARAYFSHGELEKAAEYAGHAIALDSGDSNALLLLAEISLQSGEAGAALGRLQLAAQLQPGEPRILRLQARALSKLNRTGEALEVLDTALPLTSDPLPLLLDRASMIATSQGTAAALSALEELASDYPEHPAVLASLARAYNQEGQPQPAIQTTQKALQAPSPELQPQERASLHLMLGRLLRQAGQLDQAVHHLTESTHLDPAEVDPYLELAGTQQERRQHALALKAFQKAIEVAPDDPRAYYQASLALKEGRDYQAAESMLRRAADLAPDDLAIHRQLAALVALNLVHNTRPISVEA